MDGVLTDHENEPVEDSPTHEPVDDFGWDHPNPLNRAIIRWVRSENEAAPIVNNSDSRNDCSECRGGDVDEMGMLDGCFSPPAWLIL